MAMNADNRIANAEAACPQCGAPVRLPHNAEFFPCPSCRSILVLAQGVLTHVLHDRVCVTREQAAGILKAWLDKQGFVPTVTPAVGELRSFPFIRVKRDEEERVAPLGSPPSPAVGQLAYAPTELVEVSGPVEGIDRVTLETATAVALADPRTTEVQIEVHSYYQADYAVGDGVSTRFSAVIGAGQGSVYPDALPPRSGRSMGRLQWYLLGIAVILVAEAAAVPGLWPALIAIVATAAVLCGILVGTGVDRG
jgi:hypothetical protein